jgi:hypothetical protein
MINHVITIASTRFFIYGILGIFSALLVMDTNIGEPIPAAEIPGIRQALLHVEHSGLPKDARQGFTVLSRNHFRRSEFYTKLVQFGTRHNWDFSFYAYTPAFSTSRIFLGDPFWDLGTIGKSSILVHELTHARNHAQHRFIGLTRSRDEALAYEHQYFTYRQLGLSAKSADDSVYWDMMLGVESYVLPRHPELAKRSDIKQAISRLNNGGSNERRNAGILIRGRHHSDTSTR